MKWSCIIIFLILKLIESAPIDSNETRFNDPLMYWMYKVKNEFTEFKSKVQEIEGKYDNEKKLCDEFKLQGHTNHYFHLIDFPKLKETQKDTFVDRINNTITKWRATHNHTMSSLNILSRSKLPRASPGISLYALQTEMLISVPTESISSSV